MRSSKPTDVIYDVAVIGGGNAGLCAALTAKQNGANVIVLESAPPEYRGGNSRHTRNIRCAHDAPNQLLTGAYSDDEFLSDLRQVTGSQTNEALARVVASRSKTAPEWMRRFGVRFQSPLRGTLQLSRTNMFFLGGGKSLMNAYYSAASRLGVHVVYDAEVVSLDVVDGECRSASIRSAGQTQTLRARAVVLASGGFEANVDWLHEVWGQAADNFIVRGTPYNRGTVLRLLLDAGAQPVGDARQCHAIAVDARAPRFDGGIVTRLDCLPFGIVVNTEGKRFYDEGEDLWPKRYAVWGNLIAKQHDQKAFAIIDSRSFGQFIPSVYPPIVAQSIRELAAALGLSPDALAGTVDAFNRAVGPGSFDPSVLDTCRTEGLTPNKTHWARPLDTPPFWGYPLRPGITFTYLGLRVDEHARVLWANGSPMRNVYAAGEIMAGNVLGRGYVAGVGMTIGTVFGRIAGEEAARHAVR